MTYPSMLNYEILPLGDAGLVVKLGEQITSETQACLRNLANYLMQHSPYGVVECVPAYTTLTLFYDPQLLRRIAWQDSRDESEQPDLFELLSSSVRSLISNPEASAPVERRTIELPVCYGGAHGLDLEFVAQHNNLTTAEVIELHTNGDYIVQMIGFAPGFPYLGGLSPRLAAPRRASPRLRVPAGTVGIGGNQTGVYSIDSPGGWQLIGRTPVSLFQPQMTTPSILQAGDRVRFRSITEEEFVLTAARIEHEPSRVEK